MKIRPQLPETRADKLKHLIGRSADGRVLYVHFRPKDTDTSRVLHAMFGEDAVWAEAEQRGKRYRCCEVDLGKVGLSFGPFEKGFETLMQRLWVDDCAFMYQKNQRLLGISVPEEVFPQMHEAATAMLQVPLIGQVQGR